jgi:hypothetical protein
MRGGGDERLVGIVLLAITSAVLYNHATQLEGRHIGDALVHSSSGVVAVWFFSWVMIFASPRKPPSPHPCAAPIG